MDASDEVICPIIPPINNTNKGKSEIVYVILDSGSDVDVVSEALADRLGMEKTWSEMTVVMLDNSEMMRCAFVGVLLES